MDNLVNVSSKKNEKYFKLLFLISIPILLTGRSFLGLYIFGFRIGELLTGFSIIILAYILVNYRNITYNLSPIFFISNLLIIVYFLFISIKTDTNFLDLYIFKSSVFIWYTLFFYFGYLLSKNLEIKDNYVNFGYFVLLIQFILSTIFYPETLIIFFENYSDKFQFLKASELIIIFIAVTYLGNKSNKPIYFDVFFILSSLFIPLIIFKSRGSGIAIVFYFLLQVIKYRYNFYQNKKRTAVLVFIFIILFSVFTNFLIDNSFTFEDTDDEVAKLFLYRFNTSNTFDSNASFFYIKDNKIFSSDGNLNWRLQIWQEIIKSNTESKSVIFGIGFSDKIPIFENMKYSGLDGTNENPHNFLINIFARVGLFGLLIYFVYLFGLIKLFKSKHKNLDILTFFLPLVFVSLFDASFENPYFGIFLFMFLGIFLNLKEERKVSE